MITGFDGKKSKNFVGKSDVTDPSTRKIPLDNTTIYEYTKQSVQITSETDTIKVKVENKIKTEKYDDWYVQVNRARNEDKPMYSENFDEFIPIILPNPTQPSKPSTTTTPPPPPLFAEI